MAIKVTVFLDGEDDDSEPAIAESLVFSEDLDPEDEHEVPKDMVSEQPDLSEDLDSGWPGPFRQPNGGDIDRARERGPMF